MNSNPLNSFNNFFSLFLYADSVFLSCTSELKNGKFQHYKYLHKLYKHEISLLVLHFLGFFCFTYIKK